MLAVGAEARPGGRGQLAPRRLSVAAADRGPVGAADEGAQALSGGGVAAHPVSVHAQREAGVRVSQLVHDRTGIDPEGDEDRGVGVAQLVGRETFRQRNLSGLGQLVVGRGDRLAEDVGSDVLPESLGADRGGEDERLWPGVGRLCLVGGQLVA